MPFVPDSGTESSGFVADKQGVFSRVGSSLQRRGQNMARMFNTFRQSQSTGLRGLAEAASTGVGIVGQVAGGVGDVLAEGVIEAGKAVLNEDQEREIAEFTSGIMQSKPVQSAVEKWGAFEKEHPFASAAVSGAGNIVGLVGTGGVGKAGTSAIRSAAGSAVRATGRGIMSVAEKIAPKTAGVLKTGMNIAREVSEGIGAQLTQLSPETIKSIVAGKVSKQAVESLDSASLASRAREGIKSALDDLSGLGDEYGGLRTSGATVDIPGVQLGTRATNVGITEAAGKMIPKPFTDAMSKFGLLIDPETGRITRSINSRPFQPKTIRALQDVLDTYGNTGTLGADQFLNVRAAIDNVVDWNSPDANIADALAKAVRANYDEIGKREIPGLADLDTKFAPMIDELGTLRRQFLTGKGELKDTAYTTLANLTNKGREQVLARLEKYVPGITQEIKVLRAVEDIASASGIKVGTYARGIIIGGAGLSGGAQGAILAFIATHPSVVVPLLRKYGELRRGLQPVIDDILRKINKAEPLDPPEREVFLDAITASREFQAANKTDIGGFGGGRKMTSSFRPMDASDRYAANLSDMGGNKKKAVSANSSLIAEAKKYATADEFVKASISKNTIETNAPITVYRGTGKGIGNATFVKGKYFADSREFASKFGEVSEGIIPANTRIFDFDAIKNSTSQSIIPERLLSDQDTLTQYLLDNGIEWTKNTNTRGVEYVNIATPEVKLAQKVVAAAKKYNSKADFLNDYASSDKYSEIRDAVEQYKRIYDSGRESVLSHAWRSAHYKAPSGVNVLPESRLVNVWEKANAATPEQSLLSEVKTVDINSIKTDWKRTETEVMYDISKGVKSKSSSPIIVNESGSIIDGAHRWVEAKLRGDKKIKIVTIKQEDFNKMTSQQLKDAGINLDFVSIRKGKEFDDYMDKHYFLKEEAPNETALLSEAKKYKTAEEFVNGIDATSKDMSLVDPNTPGSIFIHGTTKESANDIMKNGWNTTKTTKNAEAPFALFVGDRGEASMYGNTHLVVMKKPGMTIRTLDTSSKEWGDAYSGVSGSEQSMNAALKLRDIGYDAINHGDELEILRPEKFDFIDKSQLLDIYKKAHKK